MDTPIKTMIDYLNGLLKIEDNLIIQFKDAPPKEIQAIKDNWQQLNMIKEIALSLLEKEKSIIIEAYRVGGEDASGWKSLKESGDQYFSDTFNNQ